MNKLYYISEKPQMLLILDLRIDACISNLVNIQSKLLWQGPDEKLYSKEFTYMIFQQEMGTVSAPVNVMLIFYQSCFKSSFLRLASV